MPWGDRTGPLGLGPRSGRGLGYCAGFDSPGFVKPGPGWGFGWRRGWGRGWCRGWGRGWGRGWRWWFFFGEWGKPFTEEDEARFLEKEAELLRKQLSAVEKRLGELKAKTG